jgi:hypothetical protein
MDDNGFSFPLEIAVKISNCFVNHGKLFRFWMMDVPQIWIADKHKRHAKQSQSFFLFHEMHGSL